MHTPSRPSRRSRSATSQGTSRSKPQATPPENSHASAAGTPAPRRHPTPLEQAQARQRVESRHTPKPTAPEHVQTAAQPHAEPTTLHWNSVAMGVHASADRASTPSLRTQLPPLMSMDEPAIPGPTSTTSPDSADHENATMRWLHRVTAPSSKSLRRWPKNLLGRAACATASHVVRRSFDVASIFQGNSSEAWACNVLDRNNWPTRPLRIGVQDASLREALERSVGNCAVQWVATPADVLPMTLCRRLTLDGIIRLDVRGGFLLAIPEAHHRAAAWHDWASSRPITFAALFPGRVDCGELSLPQESTRPGAIASMRRLIEAAAVFGRHPSRLTSLDRLSGRTPTIDTLHACALPPVGNTTRDAQRLVVQGLHDSLRDETDPTGKPARLVASRVVSAFAAGVDDDLPEAARTDMVEACATIATNEPEVHLRLAAVRFASYSDSAAMDSLLTGERLLRGSDMNAGLTQVPFLQAELEAGGGMPLSLGRVAAGVTMVCAALETSRIAYFRDDVLDDARYSEWMIPKEQDRKALMEVFRGILAQREAAAAHRVAA